MRAAGRRAIRAPSVPPSPGSEREGRAGSRPLYTAFMIQRRKQSNWLRFCSRAAAAAAILAACCVPVRAQEPQQQAPSASDIAEGMRLFEQKGNCQACHGWAGDGHKTDNQMPDAPNLRDSKLNRAGLILA